jgi:hypothetical protein
MVDHLHRGSGVLAAPQSRPLPPGPPFNPAHSRTFAPNLFLSRECSQHTKCTSHLQPFLTRGSGNRTLQARKMPPSLAGRTPRLGKGPPGAEIRPANEGWVIVTTHLGTPESILDRRYMRTGLTLSACRAEWHNRPASHLAVACFFWRQSHGHAAENPSLC